MDEYIVEPETREEMIDGRIVYAAPATPPRADLHSRLGYVLYNQVAPGYVAAVDMLTRTSARWNFAADVSIRKIGTDPATGSRYLEEFALEIKHEQSMDDLNARVRQLAGRGVRRVFTICVHSRKEGDEDILIQAGPVMEWIPGEDRWTEGHWQALDADAVIEDACLLIPLPVRALLDDAEADNAVARALLARDPALVARVAQEMAYERGSAAILRETILDICDILDIEPTPERRARIEALDAGGLRALLDHIKTHRRWDP